MRLLSTYTVAKAIPPTDACNVRMQTESDGGGLAVNVLPTALSFTRVRVNYYKKGSVFFLSPFSVYFLSFSRGKVIFFRERLKSS